MSAVAAVRVAIVGTAVAATAVLGGSTAAGDDVPRNTFEAAVLATPTPASPIAYARGVHVDPSAARHVHVAAAGAAAVTCDGCRARAASLQVVYAPAATSVDVRNVVTAWAADCANCRGRAVSVQVVLADAATSVHAVNRALAVNAGCRYCAVTAVAAQFVVVGAATNRLPAETLERIGALQDRLATEAGLRTGGLRPAGEAGPLGRAVTAAAVTEMKTMLGAALGAPVTSHLKISTG